MSVPSSSASPEKIDELLSTTGSFEDLGKVIDRMTDILVPHRGEDATLFLKRVMEILTNPERFGLANPSEPDWSWFGRVVWAAYSNQGPKL